MYIEMHPRKVVALPKQQAAVIKAEHGLDVDEVMVPPSVCFIQAQTEIDCGNKLMFT